MLLDHAVTEVLLSKDYTPQTRQRRVYALREFLCQAEVKRITEAGDVTTLVARRRWGQKSPMREGTTWWVGRRFCLSGSSAGMGDDRRIAVARCQCGARLDADADPSG